MGSSCSNIPSERRERSTRFGSRRRRKGSRRRARERGASVRGGWRGGGGGAGEAVEENTREMNVRAGSVKTSRGRARKSLATTAAVSHDEKVVSTSPPTPTDGRRRSCTRQSRPVWRRAKTLGVARVHALPGACLSGLQFRRRGIPDASESDGDVVPPRGVVLGKRRTPHDVHAPRDRRLRGDTLVSWNIGLRGLRQLVDATRGSDKLAAKDEHGVSRQLGYGSVDALLGSLGDSVRVVCLQETKLTRGDRDRDLACPAGWDSVFSTCRARGARLDTPASRCTFDPEAPAPSPRSRRRRA